MTGIQYSIVIPVYRNEASIPDLDRELRNLTARLGQPLEVIYCVDGSPDESSRLLKECAGTAPYSAVIVELSRNFGSFSAIRVGLGMARGKFVAVMAADLQEPTEAVEEFLHRLEDGDVQVVVGRRVSRQDPRTTVLMSNAYWSLYRRMINGQIPAGGVDVFACSHEVAQVLAQFKETHTSLVGLLYWIGYPRATVDYERKPRAAGRSAWSLGRKIRYLSDSVYAFTDLPIIVLQVLGILGVMGSILVAGGVLAAWLLGVITEPGYTPLMLAITFSTSLLLVGLGVVGSYLWRTYENGKNRPFAIVMNRSDADGTERLEPR